MGKARGAIRFAAWAAFALCAAALLLVAGCAQQADEGAQVEFKGGTAQYGGKNLTVVLEENVTTGYVWTAALEGQGLEAAGDESKAGASGDGKTGAPGTHEFRYTGTAAGESTVTFTYARSWERTDSDQTVVLTVKTASDGTVESVDAAA